VRSVVRHAIWVLIFLRSVRTLISLKIPIDSILIKASIQGEISLTFLSTTTGRVVMGKNSIEMSPLLEISSDIK
jgi:hypothetical protein